MENIKAKCKSSMIVSKEVKKSLESSLPNFNKQLLKDSKELIQISNNMIVLKFARILNNSDLLKNQDSYIDAIDYILLFMRVAEINNIYIKPLSFLPPSHYLNIFIQFINTNLKG